MVGNVGCYFASSGRWHIGLPIDFDGRRLVENCEVVICEHRLLPLREKVARSVG